MSRIQKAIDMLKVAYSNMDIDCADYRDAIVGLQTLQAQVTQYDVGVDQEEVAPTGDDYNELFSIVTT